MKIPDEDIKSVILKYIDDDQDTIIISNSGDYEIFISQVKDNLINKLEIKIKENSDLNLDQCLANFINYEESFKEKDLNNNNNNNQNNNIINENKINYLEEVNINQNDNLSDNNENNISDNEIILKADNKIYIQNNDDINNEPNFIDNYFNYNINDNRPIFDCECSSCNKFPIKGVMFLCPECDINLCQECKQNCQNHIHELTKIETEEELIQNLEKAFEIIEKQQKEKKEEEEEVEEEEIQEIQQNNEIHRIELVQESPQENKKSNFFHIPKWLKNYWNKKNS